MTSCWTFVSKPSAQLLLCFPVFLKVKSTLSCSCLHSDNHFSFFHRRRYVQSKKRVEKLNKRINIEFEIIIFKQMSSSFFHISPFSPFSVAQSARSCCKTMDISFPITHPWLCKYLLSCCEMLLYEIVKTFSTPRNSLFFFLFFSFGGNPDCH